MKHTVYHITVPRPRFNWAVLVLGLMTGLWIVYLVWYFWPRSRKMSADEVLVQQARELQRLDQQINIMENQHE